MEAISALLQAPNPRGRKIIVGIGNRQALDCLVEEADHFCVSKYCKLRIIV